MYVCIPLRPPRFVPVSCPPSGCDVVSAARSADADVASGPDSAEEGSEEAALSGIGGISENTVGGRS